MKNSFRVRAVTARLKGHSIPPFHVVWEKWQAKFFRRIGVTGHRVQMIATVGVWIDLDKLNELVVRAAENKTHKARDGALNVEVHFVEEVSPLA